MAKPSTAADIVNALQQTKTQPRVRKSGSGYRSHIDAHSNIDPAGPKATEIANLLINHPGLEALLSTIQNQIDVRPGPKHAVTVKSVLYTLVLTVTSNRSGVLRDAWLQLRRLPPEKRVELGVKNRRSRDGLPSYNQYRRTFALLADHRTEQDHEHEFAAGIVTAILKASIEGQTITNTKAIDWTADESWRSRGSMNNAIEKAGELLSSQNQDPNTKVTREQIEFTALLNHWFRQNDPDSGAGHLPAKNGQPSGWMIGRDVHAVAARTADGQELIIGAAITRAGTHTVKAAIPLIKRVCQPSDQLAFDPGYSQQNEFTATAWNYGLDVALTHRANQTGIASIRHDAITGIAWANATPMCPAANLNDLAELGAIDVHSSTPEERNAHAEKVHQLTKLRLRKAGQTTDGRPRFTCPAEAGCARCPLKPKSMALPIQEHPTVLNPPDHPPLVCTQRTVTADLSDRMLSKTYQTHPLGSFKQQIAYATRTMIERRFAQLESNKMQFRRGWHRSTKGNHIAVLIAVLIAVSNLVSIGDRQAQLAHQTANT